MGITDETRQAILELKGVPQDFFNRKWIETPVKVLNWIYQLSSYMTQINREEFEKNQQHAPI